MTSENFDYIQAEQDIAYYEEKIVQLQHALDMGVSIECRTMVEKSIEFAHKQIARIRMAMVLAAEYDLTKLD